jgi:hypothetical protein
MFIWFKELRYQIGAFQWITKWSWQNLKMSITMGVYLTRRAGGPNPRLSGPRGQPVGPTPWLVSQGLSRPGTWLRCLYVGSQGRIWDLKVVEAERSGRPAVHLLETDLARLVEAPLYPYISPAMAEDSTTHTTCSSPLVNVLFSSASEALSRVKSWVKHSLEL